MKRIDQNAKTTALEKLNDLLAETEDAPVAALILQAMDMLCEAHQMEMPEEATRVNIGLNDNFGRMTSDEAPQHTPGPWTIWGTGGTNSGHYDGYLKSDIRAGADMIHIRQSVAGNTFPRLAANVRLIAAAPSMYAALWAIANMQITENTDKGEVLALCMSIARIELEKCSTAGK